MNLRQRGTVNRGYDHFLGTVDLPAPPTQAELDTLVPMLISGSHEAGNELISKHIRLILEIAGRYVTKINSVRLVDDFIGAGLLATTRVVDKIRCGKKSMYDTNITGVIVEAVHSAMSKTLEKVPVVSVPGSTRRTARLKGKTPPIAPKCFHFNLAENRNFEYEYDSESNIDKQGWWRDTVKRSPLISESEIRESLDRVLQSPLERSIMKLRISFVGNKPMSDREIAARLGISHVTVNIVRRDISERLKKEFEK